MSTEKTQPIYVKGIRTFAPHQNAPEFVIASGVMTPRELMDFFKDPKIVELFTEYNGQKQLKIQFLRSQNGGVNITVDTFRPDAKAKEAETIHITPAGDLAKVDDDLPF